MLRLLHPTNRSTLWKADQLSSVARILSLRVVRPKVHGDGSSIGRCSVHDGGIAIKHLAGSLEKRMVGRSLLRSGGVEKHALQCYNAPSHRCTMCRHLQLLQDAACRRCFCCLTELAKDVPRKADCLSITAKKEDQYCQRTGRGAASLIGSASSAAESTTE